MWIPQEEWQALIPDRPNKGDTFQAPQSFRARLFRFHLDPVRGLGEGVAFVGAKADDGKVTLTVEEVSAESLRLRIEGAAELSNGKTTYAPSLLGYLTYDRGAKQVTDLQMVALGIVGDTPRGIRPGEHPLGVAFELVRNPRPVEQVHPRGARDNLEGYLTATR